VTFSGTTLNFKAQRSLHVLPAKTKVIPTGLDMPRGFQEFEAPRIFRQSAHEASKFVDLAHRPPLPPLKSLHSFLSKAEWTPGLLNEDRMIGSLEKYDPIGNRTRSGIFVCFVRFSEHTHRLSRHHERIDFCSGDELCYLVPAESSNIIQVNVSR
jgi:hypothetical protein